MLQRRNVDPYPPMDKISDSLFLLFTQQAGLSFSQAVRLFLPSLLAQLLPLLHSEFATSAQRQQVKQLLQGRILDLTQWTRSALQEHIDCQRTTIVACMLNLATQEPQPAFPLVAVDDVAQTALALLR